MCVCGSLPVRQEYPPVPLFIIDTAARFIVYKYLYINAAAQSLHAAFLLLYITTKYRYTVSAYQTSEGRHAWQSNYIY